jgi:signal transduction histidine kinase
MRAMTSEGEKVNILMVDDQPAKLLSYEAILAELDQNLIRAHSAKEAMEHLLGQDFALVLMDVNMPDLDGFALANMMREHPRFRTTAIIFISGVHLTDTDRINAYRLGAVDYISVPVIPEILRAKVSVFVDLYRKTCLLERINASLESRIEERSKQLYERDQALVESEKLAIVGRLASSIAHEINNPLEAVTNLVFLARQSDSLNEVHEYLHTAEEELRRVSAIANQTLRFHRQATLPQVIEPARLVESSLTLFHRRVAQSLVEIEGNARSPCSVHCLEGEIRQVISNLIGNALDAMGDSGGCLTWRTAAGRNWSTGEPGAVITVADTGTGMSDETRTKLFNAFFTTKDHTGTGLGLWVATQIVNRHRGALRVRSSRAAARHGTVFRLFLPFESAVRTP